MVDLVLYDAMVEAAMFVERGPVFLLLCAEPRRIPGTAAAGLTEGVVFRVALLTVELLWQAALDRFLEAWCLSLFSLGSLYYPLQVCLQEDYGLRSTLLGNMIY